MYVRANKGGGVTGKPTKATRGSKMGKFERTYFLNGRFIKGINFYHIKFRGFAIFVSRANDFICKLSLH